MRQESIIEAGAFASWLACATSYSTNDLQLLPFYIYYSMFGLQRIGDAAWQAGDMRARLPARRHRGSHHAQWRRPATRGRPRPGVAATQARDVRYLVTENGADMDKLLKAMQLATEGGEGEGAGVADGVSVIVANDLDGVREEAAEAGESIEQAIRAAKGWIENMRSVRKGLEVVAALVRLTGALASGNAKLVLKAGKGVARPNLVASLDVEPAQALPWQPERPSARALNYEWPSVVVVLPGVFEGQSRRGH